MAGGCAGIWCSDIIRGVPRWDFSKLPDFTTSNLARYALGVIDQVGHMASRQGVVPYLVGGGARELIRCFIEQVSTEKLASHIFDLDFAVEGDAIELTQALARQWGGTVRIEERFRTARWMHPGGYLVDLATARHEHYPVPGQLPEVTPDATIYEDLLRRDFTVNALAISVAKDNFGELVDPVGGVGDVFSRWLRVLHRGSFLDDPTRMLRGLRYAVRLNYRMDEATTGLLREALEESYLDLLSPERVRYEIECILQEPMWFGMMWSAMNWDLLPRLHPSWGTLPTTSGEDAQVLELALRNHARLLRAELVPAWLVRLSWLLVAVVDEELPGVLNRLGIYPRLARHMVAARDKCDELTQRMNHTGFPRSRIYRVCREYSRKALLFAAFNSYLNRGTEALRRNLLLYLEDLSPRRNLVKGRRLIELGLPPGPFVKQVQEEIWWHYLDGEIDDGEAAEALAIELIARYVAS